ncbi:MAG TPA: hypothetical protein VKG24_28815 [Pseudolabrys sp.]|jgi:hypothetical protein|nr:hypothetical protein [Pseudolabrys sp.]
MADREPLPSGNEHRVIKFRRGSTTAQSSPPSPVKDLTKYERSEDADDYRHRMIVNIAAFLVVVALIGTGIWLADTMAAMRKNQDCVLSGRRNCAPVEVTKERW